MKANHILCSIAALGLLCGCASTKISVTQNQRYDFSKIKTYQWVDAPIKEEQEGSGHLFSTVRHALDNELSGRGLKEVLVPMKGDVLICCHIKLNTHQEYADLPPETSERAASGFIFSTNNQKWRLYDGDPDIHAYTIETVMLTLEVKRTALSEPLWKGRLQTEVDRSRPTIEQNKRIHHAIRRLMLRFPI